MKVLVSCLVSMFAKPVVVRKIISQSKTIYLYVNKKRTRSIEHCVNPIRVAKFAQDVIAL